MEGAAPGAPLPVKCLRGRGGPGRGGGGEAGRGAKSTLLAVNACRRCTGVLGHIHYELLLLLNIPSGEDSLPSFVGGGGRGGAGGAVSVLN